MMKALIVSAVAAFVAVVAACSSSNGAAPARLCTPGAYVFCKCANGGKGTKQCDADGQGFGDCATNDTGQCVGGEVADPDTGKPVVSKDDPTIVPTPIASDSCPGQGTSVTPDVTQTINGDTTNAANDRTGSGSCSASVGANDQIYHLVPSASGTLKVVVTKKDTLDPIVYLRTVCDDASSQASCGKAGSAANGAQLQRDVGKGGDYFLFVDGASSTKGGYTATITLTAHAVCGDGIVDPGEACDDHNNNDGDGCTKDCRSPSGDPDSAIACPGQPVDLWTAGTTVSATGSNNDARGANVWASPGTDCSKSSTNPNPVHIYAVTPHVAGTLVVSLPPSSANLMLVARSTCTDVGSQVACSNNGQTQESETMMLAVKAGVAVYIGVTGGAATGAQGDYAINFKLQ